MKYEEQERKIYAKYDDKTIRVYQAYNDVIADEAIKAKDENDFERLHTIIWLFKLYNINAYIALFCIVAIYSDQKL